MDGVKIPDISELLRYSKAKENEPMWQQKLDWANFKDGVKDSVIGNYDKILQSGINAYAMASPRGDKFNSASQLHAQQRNNSMSLPMNLGKMGFEIAGPAGAGVGLAVGGLAAMGRNQTIEEQFWDNQNKIKEQEWEEADRYREQVSLFNDMAQRTEYIDQLRKQSFFEQHKDLGSKELETRLKAVKSANGYLT